MTRRILTGALGAALCSLASLAGAQSNISWNGSVSTDAFDGANWNGGVAPSFDDTATIGSSPQSPDYHGGTAFYSKFTMNFANNIADSVGGATLVLDGPDNSQFFTAGDNHVSTFAPNINATKNIQTNGTHSVIFNGQIVAKKIEAFGGSAATLNGQVTQTDEFMSIGGGSKVVINNNFYWNNNNHGINNNPTVELGAGAKLYRPDGGGGYLEGLDVFNVYDHGTIRLLADNAFGTHGETDLWTRNTTNTFDLNGHSQFVEFFGMGDAPAALNIDFGAAVGANTLIWDAAAGLNGPGGFSVLHFQQGLDTLEFGQYGDNNGFHNPAILARITINGAPYSANPISGPYWTAIPTPSDSDDPGRQIAVYHVPEPASMALAACAALGLATVRRKS